MKTLTFNIGDKVSCNGKEYIIYRLVNLNWVLGKEINSSKIEKLRIPELTSISVNASELDDSFPPIDLTSEEDWLEANRRLLIIKPILDNNGNGEIVKDVIRTSGYSKATLYRWKNAYQDSGLLSSLVPSKSDGGRGQSRLSPEIESIISSAIEDTYTTTQRKSVQKVCLDVILRCKNAKLTPPNANTIRFRIDQIDEYKRLLGRYGKKAADQKFKEKIGSMPGADYPLAVVQIDHTKMDIIVVDDTYRRPIGRPWLTLAIDVYSRMVTGFYISLDAPGSMGTGLCICHSILQKDKWLAKINIDSEWPCWGIMTQIHADNAREFRGNMLKRACQEYNIELRFRPVKKPHYGGHIERLMGTFMTEIHSLPGTTFSNIKEKNNYESEKEAVFTLKELEVWLTTYITKVYHQRFHNGIQMSPIAKYNEGIFGTEETQGIGIPAKIESERKLRLDFMPYEERTIQDYGVVIDNISYYHDVMRRWINATVASGGKNRTKIKFIFKRDPKDISVVYFLDPELKEYFEIPYRNIGRPPMSIWEHREIIKKLKDQGRNEINEDMIFEAYELLAKIEQESVLKTIMNKTMNGKTIKRVETRKNRAKGIHKESHLGSPEIVQNFSNLDNTFDSTPFDEIEF